MQSRSIRVLILAIALPVTAPAQADQQTGQRLKQARLTLVEAIQKGVKEAGPEAGPVVPFKAEFEIDKGKAVFSIDLAQGKQTLNVVIDAGDGSVVEKETEDGDHTAATAACKVSLAKAIDAALASTKGQAMEATLRLAAGKPVIDVVVFDGTLASTVRVDGVAATVIAGKVAEVVPPQGGGEKKWTEVFHTTPDEFTATGRSTFMILEPGYRLTFQGKEGSKTIDLVVSVLDETKKVDGVETRVVEERESEDGKLIEVSRNYFAISKKTGSVFYFGEDVDMYKDGKVHSHEGAWLAGQNGARSGVFLPGIALLGARFYQEIAPEVAMDRAEIVSLDETVDTPAGRFEKVMKYEETTPLEKAREYKWFAPGVGLIQDAELKLVKIGK
ncbi:MAG TPA: hypothetical protein VFT55_03065 [Planctomycetota bacterium]|nr:hypothetical protein [Planctomycetota bacterium]